MDISFKLLILLLQMKGLDKSSVHIRDLVGLRTKLRKLYEDGAQNLQVLYSLSCR